MLPAKYIKGLLWMARKQVEDMKKEEFKGSSKKGNTAIGSMGRSMKRSLKKTFK
tara:strand:+ start:373 stop:534 length:162 start_codon:yes stop_codon:yes gene_type:complete